MDKRKINQFHTKYPFVEPILLFVIGILIGIFSSLLTGEISAANNDNWRIVDSHFFRIVSFMTITGIVYYWKFSSYSIGKQIHNSRITSNALIDLILIETKKMAENDSSIAFEKKLMLIQKSASTIRKVDETLSGSWDDDK